MKSESLATGIVADGRTVVTDDGDKGPGETVTLPAAEIRRLSELGYFADPDAPPIIRQGPASPHDIAFGEAYQPAHQYRS